jgi:2,3-bisphosphoglycerate-dependent phosphoglycerate mutase
MKTELILIRHGETEWNRAGRVQGHLDSALTAEGIAQAEACAERLRAETLDAVFASDLGRVRHTTQLLLAGREIPLETSAALRERAFGVGEGMTHAEIDQRFPQAFSRTRATDPDFAFDGGESKRQFHERITTVLQQIADGRAGQRLLIVTHGGVLGVVYRWINQLPIAGPLTIEIPNVAYNCATLVGGNWTLTAWADTAHLPTTSFERG